VATTTSSTISRRGVAAKIVAVSENSKDIEDWSVGEMCAVRGSVAAWAIYGATPRQRRVPRELQWGVSDNTTNDICAPGDYCPVTTPASYLCILQTTVA
jgi:hypothetical protein